MGYPHKEFEYALDWVKRPNGTLNVNKLWKAAKRLKEEMLEDERERESVIALGPPKD
jgi:hypothetical protein